MYTMKYMRWAIRNGASLSVAIRVLKDKHRAAKTKLAQDRLTMLALKVYSRWARTGRA